jgi:16S rRNA (guanine527-N7)-methyltransferase
MAIEAILDLLEREPAPPTAVSDRERAWRIHVADSLAGIEFDELAASRRVADLGSGAGFPGLVVAAAQPQTRVDLIESTGRKCDFLARAASAARLANVEVICDRAETWAAGPGGDAYEAVTARAVGRLSTVAELASPLLAEGGALLAWKGRRDQAEEEELRRAIPRTAMEPLEVRRVDPYPGSRHRHIHLIGKRGPTPDDLPRRPGLARKRPFGSQLPSRTGRAGG